MLHVRVVSPADRTGQLVEALATLPGVQNLVVQAGARRPEGDAVVYAEVTGQSSNDVVFSGQSALPHLVEHASS